MTRFRLAMGDVPRWARVTLVVLPLLLALNAAAVEIQFGNANKEIPGGSQHDQAWKTYHRIRLFNRATLGISGAAAIIFAVGFLSAGRGNHQTSTP